jgi:hypothetical protein
LLDSLNKKSKERGGRRTARIPDASQISRIARLSALIASALGLRFVPKHQVKHTANRDLLVRLPPEF